MRPNDNEMEQAKHFENVDLEIRINKDQKNIEFP